MMNYGLTNIHSTIHNAIPLYFIYVHIIVFTVHLFSILNIRVLFCPDRKSLLHLYENKFDRILIIISISKPYQYNPWRLFKMIR